MSIDGVRVSGGAGGIEAALEDVEDAARQLCGAGALLALVAGALADVARSPALGASAAQAPATGIDAERELLRACALAGALGGEAEVLAGSLSAAALGYRAADGAAARAVAAAHDAAGVVAGRWAVTAGAWAAVTGGAVLAAATAAGVGAAVAGRAGLAAAGTAAGGGDWRRAGRDEAADALGDAGSLAAAAARSLGSAAGTAAYRWPGLAGGAAAGADGVLLGAAPGLALAAAAVDGVAHGMTGAPPRSAWQRTVGLLQAAGGRALDDGGRARVARLPTPLAAPGAGAVRAPRDLADLTSAMDQVGALTIVPRRAQEDPWRSRVRVTRVPQPDGSDAWVVVVPGTQHWGPSGDNPSDLAANLALMSRADAAVVDAVRLAMVDAGVRPGEPVLLAGHSQGGIVAATLAADPDSPYTVTHVYTAGSPIADVEVPDGVQVLAVEHRGDLVPQLDGGGVNPAGPQWTTVVAPVPAPAAPPVPGSPFAGAPPAVAAHDSRRYRRTAEALDRSGDPSVRAWRESAAPFFRGRGEVVEYRMSRGPAS